MNAIFHTLEGVCFVGFNAENRKRRVLYQIRIMSNNKLIIHMNGPTLNRNEMSFLVENNESDNRILKGIIARAAPLRNEIIFDEICVDGKISYYQRVQDPIEKELEEIKRIQTLARCRKNNY